MSLDDIAKKLKTNDLKRIMKYAEKFRKEEVEYIDETDEMVGEDRRKGPLFQPVGDKEAKARIAHTKQEIKFKKLDKRRNEEVEDIDEAGFDVPSKTKKKNKNGGFQKKAEKITINPTLEKFNVKDYIKNIHTEAMAIEALEWGTDASVNAFKAATPGESPNTRPVADYSMDRPELDEAGARDHYRKFQKKLGATMPAIDKTEYPEIRGLEGPFRFKKGKILYYDPKEGKYYDNKTDIYVDVNPNMI